MQNPKRGDVVWLNLDPAVGAQIQKRRPCVVVSLSVLNEKRLTVVVVPLSTASTPRPPLVVAVPSAGAASNVAAQPAHLLLLTKPQGDDCVGRTPSCGWEALFDACKKAARMRRRLPLAGSTGRANRARARSTSALPGTRLN